MIHSPNPLMSKTHRSNFSSFSAHKPKEMMMREINNFSFPVSLRDFFQKYDVICYLSFLTSLMMQKAELEFFSDFQSRSYEKNKENSYRTITHKNTAQ